MTSSLAARLDRALRAQGLPIVGVSIGREDDKQTWRVHPASQQAAAQPVIDAFDPDAPAHTRADVDAGVEADEDVRAVIPALLKELPAILAEHTVTGKVNQQLWARRIESTTKVIERSRKGV